MSFGTKIAWLAVRNCGADEIARVLECQGLRETTWKEGVKLAYESRAAAVFLTPVLDGWTLVAGVRLLEWLTPGSGRFAERVAELSAALHSEVQFFASYRITDDYAWVLAREGRLERAFYYSSDDDEEAGVDLGARTRAETLLDLEFDEERSPTEEDVARLAAAWSIDPNCLNGLEVPHGYSASLPVAS